MNETFETENEDDIDLVRHYSKRINFYLPPQPFKERYRVSHEQARLLIQKMSPYYEVKGNRTSNMTIDQKILLGLQCLASSAFYYVIADSHGNL